MSALIIWPWDMDDAPLSFPRQAAAADLLPQRVPHWWPRPRQDDPPSLELLDRVLDGLRRL